MREKLIELLKKANRAFSVDRFNCDHFGFVADHLIAHGVTVQQWIPASEPPKSIANKVIVLCKNGYRGFGHYEDYKGKKTWYNLESDKPFTDWNYDEDSYEVTHWMPLPKAPKGE